MKRKPQVVNGVWKAINENTYQWGDYKLFRSIHGWTVWCWGDHNRRVGNADLMSQAMELARQDAIRQP
jgi:hypothetical protein